MWISDLPTLASGHAPALVSALLHSLWQAALLACVCKVALLVVPCRRPNWRYTIALASLAMVVMLFLVTLRLQTRQPSPSVVAPAHLSDTPSGQMLPVETPPTDMPPAAPAPAPNWSATAPSSAPTWQTALGCLWLAGVLLMLLRAVRILHGERRTAGTAQPVGDPDILALLDRLRARFRITRRVLLATVDAACSPAVLGVVSPVILVPTAILTGSPPDHLRAILAHELAHIRRWDVLANVLQLLVESLFFHNPFVWLLSAQIRREREACCDAVAADCCGGAPAYARALVDVGQLVLATSPAVSFARPNGLSDRVRRLLGLRPAGDTWRLPMASLVIALLAGMSTILVVAQGTTKATDAVLSATERLRLIEQTVAQQKDAATAAIGATRYTGQIATPGGGLLPKGTRLTVWTAKPNGSTWKGLTVDRETGRFDTYASGRSAMLWLQAPGYAPWLEGPMVPGPEPVTDTGVWVLEPQRPLVVRVLDDKGKPVPDAKVAQACHPVPNVSFLAGSSFTDAAGECIVPFVTDYPVSMTITTADFEPATFDDLDPAGNEPLVFRLNPSLPLVLHIFDRRTGLPVPGARIRQLAKRTPFTSAMYSLDRALVLGTSAADGTCGVSGLHREGVYWILVSAEGYGTELVEGGAPGKRYEVRLGPPRVLTGTITGDLAQLMTTGKGQPTVRIDYMAQPPGFRQLDNYTRVPVHVKDGEGTFRADGLPRSTFHLWAGGESLTVSMKEGDRDVNIDISKRDAPEEPTREIQLALARQPGVPLPRGTMRVQYKVPKRNYHTSEDFPVTDGVATLRAPVGSSIRYDATGLVSGWFPPGRIQSIPAGDDPLAIHIAFVPAGAISVSVFGADGKPTDGFLASVREITKSPYRKDGPLGVRGKNGALRGDGVHTFTATPLPLGGTYEIVVHRGYTYVTTGQIRLTEQHPLRKQRLVLAGNATITGQVVGPGGAPLGKAPIELCLRFANHSFRSSDIETDTNGRFEFPGIVQHPGGEYTIRVEPRRDFTPKRAVVKDLGQPVRIVTEPGLIVTGQILDGKDDAPVLGAQVTLWRTIYGDGAHFRRFHTEGLTDGEGRFRFSNLLPGKYELHCSSARHDAKKPNVTAGQAEPVIWRVPIRRWSVAPARRR